MGCEIQYAKGTVPAEETGWISLGLDTDSPMQHHITIRDFTIKNVQTKRIKAQPHEMRQIAVNRILDLNAEFFEILVVENVRRVIIDAKQRDFFPVIRPTQYARIIGADHARCRLVCNRNVRDCKQYYTEEY